MNSNYALDIPSQLPFLAQQLFLHGELVQFVELLLDLVFRLVVEPLLGVLHDLDQLPGVQVQQREPQVQANLEGQAVEEDGGQRPLLRHDARLFHGVQSLVGGEGAAVHLGVEDSPGDLLPVLADFGLLDVEEVAREGRVEHQGIEGEAEDEGEGQVAVDDVSGVHVVGRILRLLLLVL